MPEIEKIRSYNDLKDFLGKRGISLTTPDKELRGMASEDLEGVATLGQRIAVAVESYRDAFGKDSLKALKRISIFDNSISGQGAYVFRAVGERPSIEHGTLKLRSAIQSDYREVFHELAHAYQDTHKGKGEDIVSYSDRMIKTVGLSSNVKAYSGAIKEHEPAERFAEAFAHAFVSGDKDGMSFMKRLRRIKR